MRLVARIVLHVPERRGVIMVHDPAVHKSVRFWRPPGGHATRGSGTTGMDIDWIAAGIREVNEEIGVLLTRDQVSFVNERVSSMGNRVVLGYAEISEFEARWMYPNHPDSEDLRALLTYEELVMDSFRGVAIHPEYRRSMIEDCKLPLAA